MRSSKDYNVLVPSNNPAEKRSFDRRTLGLIIIVLLIFVYAVVRWGGTIPWAAR